MLFRSLIRGDGRKAGATGSTAAFTAGRDPVPLSDSVAAFILDRGWEQVTAELDAMLDFTAVPREQHSRLACQIVVEYFMDGLRVYLPERQF